MGIVKHYPPDTKATTPEPNPNIAAGAAAPEAIVAPVLESLQDYFDKKGNTISFDDEEEKVLNIIDLTVRYLTKQENFKEASEITSYFESLEELLGTRKFEKYFEFIDEGAKFEDKRQIWYSLLYQPEVKKINEKAKLVSLKENMTRSLFAILKAIKDSVPILKMEEDSKKTVFEMTPLPAYTSTYKTMVSTPVHKGKLIGSSEPSVGSSEEADVKTIHNEDPFPGKSFKERAALEPSYDHYKNVMLRVAQAKNRFNVSYRAIKAMMKIPDVSTKKKRIEN